MNRPRPPHPRSSLHISPGSTPAGKPPRLGLSPEDRFIGCVTTLALVAAVIGMALIAAVGIALVRLLWNAA